MSGGHDILTEEEEVTTRSVQSHRALWLSGSVMVALGWPGLCFAGALVLLAARSQGSGSVTATYDVKEGGTKD